MKKHFWLMITAMLAFVWVYFPQAKNAYAEINYTADFENDTIIVSVKQHPGGVHLFSSGSLFNYSFKEFGISKAESLDIFSDDSVSLFSADRTETLKLTLENPSRENVIKTVEELNELPYVEYAEPNYIVTLASTPNDPDYLNGNQYGLNKINAPAVWDMNIDGSDIIVAVIDSGIKLDHPDLTANIWTNPGETSGNGIDDDNNGFADDVHGWNFYISSKGNNNPTDENGHGTHVSGIISAVTDNGEGVASLARNVKILPIKAFGSQMSTTVAKITKAINYAKLMKADIVNCSFGMPEGTNTLSKAIESYEGAVFVAAAGNTLPNGSNNDITPYYPASYEFDNIISVASTDQNDVLSSFSNYGEIRVDIAAPGSDIFSTYYTNSTLYKSDSGTSMACPFVSSAAALVRAKYPELTPAEVIKKLEDGADRLDSLTGKVKTGARLNAYNSLLSPTPVPTEKPSPAPTPISTPIPTTEPTATQASTPSASTEFPTAEPTIIPTTVPTNYPVPIGYSVKFVEDYNERLISVKATAPNSDKYCVIFAYYNGNKLTGIEIFKEESGNKVITSSKPIGDANTVKVIMWRSIDSMEALAHDTRIIE